MVGNPLKEGLNVIDGKASPGNGSARGVQDAPNNAQTLRRRRRVILSTGTKTDLAAHIQFAARWGRADADRPRLIDREQLCAAWSREKRKTVATTKGG